MAGRGKAGQDTDPRTTSMWKARLRSPKLQTSNGDGTGLSSWVSFYVMDYGQEDYVFGSSTADARHWDTYVLKVFEEHADTLAELFN